MLTVQLLHIQGRGPPPTAPIAVGPHAAAPRLHHGESSEKSFGNLFGIKNFRHL